MIVITKENFKEVMESIIKGVRESKEIAYNPSYIHLFNQRVLYEFGYLMKQLSLRNIDLLKYVKPLFDEYQLIWDETKTIESLYTKKLKEIPDDLEIKLNCPLLENFVPQHSKNTYYEIEKPSEYKYVMEKEMLFYLKENSIVYIAYNPHVFNNNENYLCKIKRNDRGEILFKGYHTMIQFIEDLLYKKVEIYLTQKDFFDIKEEMMIDLNKVSVSTIKEVTEYKKEKKKEGIAERQDMKKWLESFCSIVNSSY